MQSLRVILAAVLVLAGFIPFAQAQGVQIADYIGYAWETGGFPPSNSGDVLHFVGVTTASDPLLGVDLAQEEATCHVYGLVSQGQLTDNPAPGWTTVIYTGGTLEMYRDAQMNADYGINPPNGTAPSTFVDGTLLLRGNFTSFYVRIDPSGAGTFGGNADGVAGELITTCTGCIYTWGGSFTQASGAQIPTGYDMQMDGVLEIDPAVPTQSESAWGALKASYTSSNR